MKDDVQVNTPSSLAEETFLTLQADILSARLAGGTIVQERRLAARLNVSRSPLRDALGRLEGLGLLVRNSRGALAVRVVTLEDYLNSLAIRYLIEPEAAALACGALSGEEQGRLSAMLARIEAEAEPDPDYVWEFDDLLHQTIAARSGNPFMLRTVTELRRYTTIFERQIRIQRLKPGVAEHARLLAAVLTGSAEDARQAMARHLERAREGVLQNY
jgi:DNA-binding GntR family transcriptional regulator